MSLDGKSSTTKDREPVSKLRALTNDASSQQVLTYITPSVLPPPPPTSTLTHYLKQPLTASFIAGGVAGAVSRTVVSPLERLKIILQVQGREMGNGTNCIRIVPYSAVQFSSYTIYKKVRYPQAPSDEPSLMALAHTVATYPLDIVRTRLSVQSASFEVLGKKEAKLPGMFQTMKIMYQTEGVAPYVGINFATYEAMRKFVTPEGEMNPTAIGKLVAGGVSGAVAQSITYPFDVLRRRFQVNTMSGIGYKYKSLWDAITIILRAEGVRVAPSIGSSFLSYEITRDLLTGLVGGI
ncbi:mitochondrial carrier domain-containing protein [Trichophaea hybrida]|nr:mitochondrial carrier domain-containing protein [Trichophaea hybrida]